MAPLDDLEALWADSDEALPFSSTVNEARVLQAVRAVYQETGEVDDALRVRVRQWIRFNKAANEFEGEPYQTWVHEVYSHLEALMREPSTSTENNRHTV